MEGISIFDQCAHGIQYALLLIAPSFYVVAALRLFVVLGVVIQCWAERQRRKTASYSPFTDSDSQIMKMKMRTVINPHISVFMFCT